ncbi:MAG: ORF6N domain-containing protein, partial [Proteobacteria bacterium]|nr:ORF6N domain-containing protein [Pseudomonadota bacterium]
MKSGTNQVTEEGIARRILVLRGQRVILDTDLASLYGIETRVLNQAVRRNPARFPTDFMFQLSADEFGNWRSQVVMSNPGAKMGLRRAPLAFTEHGAIMAASILNSPRAIEASVYVVRAFVRMRDTLATHKVLAAKLEELEEKTEALTLRHDALAANTRAQFRQVLD